jgi:hypothetical protein
MIKNIRKVRKNTVNKYMADIRPDRLTTCQSEGKSVESSRRKSAPAPLLSITKSHMTRLGFEPGLPRWEAGENCICYTGKQTSQSLKFSRQCLLVVLMKAVWKDGKVLGTERFFKFYKQRKEVYCFCARAVSNYLFIIY